MEETANGSKGSFFACYLLTSLNPRYKGCHYIGFTVNPRRRIRQHNGELTSGAWRTHRKRPWDMVLCVYGFASQVEALQFEWAWQHPFKSLAVKEAAARIPSSVRGLKKQFYLLFTMLNCDKWSIMDLNVQFLSSKYIDYRKGCPVLPPHMGLCIAPVDTLPMSAEEADSELDVDVEKERMSESNFSDTEQDDPDPPTENQNCSRGEIVRPLFCDMAEKQSEPLDVIEEPVASISGAPFIAQPLVNTMDLSAQAKVTILGDRRQAVDDDDYTIRKAHIGDDELFPICHRQEPASSLCVQVEASVSADLHHILETSPRNLCRSKDMAVEDARGQSKTKPKSTSEVSESEDVERRNNSYGDDCLESLPEVLLSSPSESGANEMPSKSPFSAFLEQYPVKPPSSIVRRCLEQKSKAHIPDSSGSIRNLTSEVLPENLPNTPPPRSRVVVVIPDFTPIAASREVIDLTDSPF